ncbi:MAG: glycoside hydrolase domain-containing protein [Candidatus Dormibacteria bacterium]
MAYGAGPMASIVLAATALAGLVNAQPAHAGADTARPQPLTVATSGGGAWWGIDTVTNVETGNIIAQTTSELGAPQFVGRYLIYSSELSGTEARYIHQQGLSILLIDDPNRAFTSGTTDAQQALAQATSLGVAQGVAIFRDVETSDPITSTYIAAYVAAFAGSRYIPGFYENPINGAFSGAYCSLISSDPASVRGALLYSSEPEQTGANPRRSVRPHFAPNVPGCANHTAAWQYLERGLFPTGTWPNVDVDELPARFSKDLWS